MNSLAVPPAHGPRRLTVLALALEAGFNSKSTFNRIFKEKTDLTPKGYRKKYQPT